ncbi:MAG TPA: cytochrome c-type biogenesis protein [Solirubrobacteraceae bacterium]|nr:cytochrome c-type biogenesis protein [Solirubrobacteraceae bacterium]
MSRRPPAALALLLTLGALLVGVCAGAVPASAASSRPSLAMIERNVMCTVCGVPLEEADSPQANDEKAYIIGLLDQGQNYDQIKKALVAQYGPAVLALPPASGFDLTVYIVPVIVVLAVAGLLAILLPRWRRRSPAPATTALPSLSASDSARLDEDLARFDG